MERFAFYITPHGELYITIDECEYIITGIQVWYTSIDQEPHLILV